MDAVNFIVVIYFVHPLIVIKPGFYLSRVMNIVVEPFRV